MSGTALYDLPLATPESRAQIAAIQSARKRLAVERARRSPFWKPRLDHVGGDRLDDPDEWRKIPILFKEELRALGDERFHLFADRELNDFKAEAATGDDGNDLLRLSIEVARDADASAVAGRVAAGVRGAFEVTPEVAVLDAGTLAREFESSVKAPRFVDRRG